MNLNAFYVYRSRLHSSPAKIPHRSDVRPDEEPGESVPAVSTDVLRVLQDLNPDLLASCQVDGGQRSSLFRGHRSGLGTVTGGDRSPIYQDVRFFAGGVHGHAVDEEDVGSCYRSREDAGLFVVGVADVGGDGVVDYGAVGSDAEGVGGVVGVESDCLLGSACTYCIHANTHARRFADAHAGARTHARANAYINVRTYAGTETHTHMRR